jgi:tetratricopeptide (TPR) repeat protein/predicted Ser/Thr protein kinase
MPFVVGENVGPYRITAQLGTGGMATVWKAYHAALDRYVALKVLHRSFKEDPQFTARFQREAKIVAKLTHPHIVPIYDFSEHEGMSYLVMRYVEGRTLKAVLKQDPLAPDKVLDILTPAAEALAYAHRQGVLHRDIKPSNFLIDLEGEVFLTDFGLARMAESTDSTMSRDMMIGTPQYISPEQARGATLDEGTDIYSLGVVLFEMLTGKTPYDADTPYAIIHDHIFSPLPLPSQFRPDIPETVERVVLKALAKDRDDRYQSVSEMISALEDAVVGERVEAAPEVEAEVAPHPVPEVEAVEEVEPVEKAPSRFRSRRLILAVVGLAAALSLCFCCFLLWISGREGEQSRRPAAHIHLARQYLQQGNIEGAISEYEAAIQLDPQAVDAYLGLGSIYLLKERDPDLALDMFKQASEIEPDNVKALLGAANAFFLLEDYESAVRHYQRVAELDPSTPEPHARLGIYHILEGEVEQGLAECERALQLEPELPESHLCMGAYFADQGDTEQARREFGIVAETGPPILAEQARRQLDRLD